MKDEDAKNTSSSKLPLPLTFGAANKTRYKKSKEIRDIDHQIHCEKLKIRQELKVANEVASLKLQLLKEISRLPAHKKLALKVNGSSILDSYYTSEFSLPPPRTLSPKPILALSLKTSAKVRNRTISKPFNINCKLSALDYARSITPVHSAQKSLVCSRCFQNRLTCAIGCGKSYVLCIGCVKC